MDMKDMGKNRASMYPTSVQEDKGKSYPMVMLPLGLVEKELQVGDEVSVKLKGKVKSINKNEYNSEFYLELEEGCCEAEEKEEETLVGKE